MKSDFAKPTAGGIVTADFLPGIAATDRSNAIA